jgi:hypothetical protein
MTKLKFKDHSLMLSSNERTQLGGQSLGKSLPSRWSFKKDTRGSTIPNSVGKNYSSYSSYSRVVLSRVE